MAWIFSAMRPPQQVMHHRKVTPLLTAHQAPNRQICKLNQKSQNHRRDFHTIHLNSMTLKSGQFSIIKRDFATILEFGTDKDVNVQTKVATSQEDVIMNLQKNPKKIFYLWDWSTEASTVLEITQNNLNGVQKPHNYSDCANPIIKTANQSCGNTCPNPDMLAISQDNCKVLSNKAA